MAERLRSFDFTAQSAITSAWSKGRTRYPWNEWFDGDIWKITQGTDFDTSPLMMERIIRTRASNPKNKAKVTLRHIREMGNEPAAIVLQRTDIVGPTAAKKAEQATKRAAKKAAAAAEATQFLASAGIPKANGHAVKSVSKRPAKKAPVKRAPAKV